MGGHPILLDHRVWNDIPDVSLMFAFEFGLDGLMVLTH